MIIKLNNGTTREAMILTRTADTLRVAMQGSDDAVELQRIRDVWVTDDCEPVHVAFALERPAPVCEVTEADCICSPELAARLIHLLYAAEEPHPETPALGPQSSGPRIEYRVN